MRKYCKAYKLKDMRQFSGWSVKPEPDNQALTDDVICYLWDDYIVVKSPIQPAGILFDAVTAEWQEFCKTVLKFEIPEDLRYAYEPAKE
jgi:hypothetical protein